MIVATKQRKRQTKYAEQYTENFNFKNQECTIYIVDFQYIRLNSFSAANGGGRENVQKIVILLTDGKNNGNPPPEHEAGLLKKQNVTIITIGVGTEYLMSELKQIASQESYVFTTNSFAELSTILDDVVALACDSK